MKLLIDSRGERPIYEQLLRQIRAQILSGELKADEALPSIRALAKDLRISVVTTKRAYEELEGEGLIYTIAAKGCFVARTNRRQRREANVKDICRALAEAAALARGSGLERCEFEELARASWEEGL